MKTIKAIIKAIKEFEKTTAEIVAELKTAEIF